MNVFRAASLLTVGLLYFTTGSKGNPTINDVLPPMQPSTQDSSKDPNDPANPENNRNKDWLLNAYEKRAHERATQRGGTSDANLYYQIATNKDLAKIAGISPLDTDDTKANSYRTGAQQGQNAATLRPETSSPTLVPSQSFFKPLITPLSAPEAAGLHNFYSSLPTQMVSPSASISPTSSRSASNTYQDFSDIETPGMVAAEKNDPSSLALTLDILPGESIDHARQHQDTSMKLELPVAINADQLHREQAALLSVPGAPQLAQKPKTDRTSANVSSTPTEDPNAPLPVSKTPQITPIRTPIASPFDILGR